MVAARRLLQLSSLSSRVIVHFIVLEFLLSLFNHRSVGTRHPTTWLLFHLRNDSEHFAPFRLSFLNLFLEFDIDASLVRQVGMTVIG